MKSRVIDSEDNLYTAIQALELDRERELHNLKEGVQDLYQSVRPVNLIKHTVQEITSSPDLKEKLLLVGVAIAAGHVSKLLYQSTSKSPLKKLIGAALQFGVTNIITHKPELMSKIGHTALNVVKAMASNSKEPQYES